MTNRLPDLMVTFKDRINRLFQVINFDRFQARNRCHQTQKRGTAYYKLAGTEKIMTQSREAESLDREEPERKAYCSAGRCITDVAS